MSLLFSRWRGRSPGLSKPDDRRRAGRNRRSLSLEMMESRMLLASGTITPLVHTVPNGSGTALLQTNGNVIMVGGGDSASNEYYVLHPDAQGNYVDGTWSQAASSQLPRLFNGSVILPDGRMLVIGGEYSGANTSQNETNEGEIYNPTTNSWSTIATFPNSSFGDDLLENLGGGKVLALYNGGFDGVNADHSYIYDANANTWTQTGTKLYGDSSTEEGLTQLADGSFLDYNISSSFSDGKPEAQRYIPSTGTWVAAGNPTQLLSDQNYQGQADYELGGGMLLPDGRVFWVGGNGNTQYYTPGTNTWTAGPAIPGGLVQDDAPVAEADNGVILLSADTPLYTGPSKFFEYNPTTQAYTDITSEFPAGFNDGPAFVDRMTDLPNGQILISNGGNQLAVYTPAGSALAANVPTIKSIVTNNNGTFHLSGTGLNGNSEGATFGDDANMASNYPIVSFTSPTTGLVLYATTANFNYQVEQGAKTLTTDFTPPSGLNSGAYAVRVIANGAASAPFTLSVVGPTIVQPATANPNPVLSTTTNLSVLGADAGGEANLTYTWVATTSPNGATPPTFATNGTNASKNDKVTFHAVGAYTFTVTVTNQTGISTTSAVSVNVNPSLATFGLSPSKVQLAPNSTFQFVASGLDQFGNTINSSTSFVWSLTGGGGSVSSTGLYTSPVSGTIATVKVTTGTLSLTSTVYVLSSPWQQADIGTPATGGDAADNGAGTFTVIGAGTGISGTSDQFQFAYLAPAGNSTVEAQVGSLQNTSSAAEAGVMFRNDASAGSANVSIGITPSNGLVFSYRSVANGTTISLTTPRVTAGDYVKLVRVGNLFSGYYSTNGTTWIQVGTTINVAMNATIDAGLAATSSSASTLNTAVFNHVLGDAVPYVVNPASANPNPVTGTTTKLSVLGGDAAGESVLAYTWVTSANAAGAVTPTFATNGTNASKNDLVTFYKAGTYTFTVTMADPLGYSTTSSVTVTVTPTQTKVVVNPLNASVVEGGTVQFTAAVDDQFGFPMASQPRFTYSIIAGGVGGKISSSGLYTAPSNKVGIDYVNVTGAGTAAVAKVLVSGSIGPAAKPATIDAVSAGFGSDAATLVTAGDGLRLLPVGRKTDLPWSGIRVVAVALSQAETLLASDVKVTGIAVANYGPVTITPVNATTYLITLARPIGAADRVTVTIASPQITTFTRRLDVLPGDVNDDGLVNSTDATIADAYLLSTYIDADVLGAGVVSKTSVTKIQLLNGTTLPRLT